MNKTQTFTKTLKRNPQPLFLKLKLVSSPSTKTLHEFVESLQRCANSKNLIEGRRIHSQVIVNGFLASPSTITSLINMYSKCSRMDQALSVFQHHSDHLDRSVFFYNAMISGFVSNGKASQALGFYRNMRELGVSPDKFTFPCAVRACCDLSDVLEVRKIHGVLFKVGLELDVFVGSALVKAFLRIGIMDAAQRVFEEMPVRDVVLWNSLVNGYAQIGCVDEALGVWKKMSEDGVVPSSFTVTGILSIFTSKCDLVNGKSVHGLAMKTGYDSVVEVSNALIDFYGKCGSPRDALEIFEAMEDKDDFSWNSIISVHDQSGDYDIALEIFGRMLSADIRPDFVTLNSVLPACSHSAGSIHGREIHGYAIRNYFGLSETHEDAMVNNALMDMYSKSGDTKNAGAIFGSMPRKHVASWNIMIMGYAVHGLGGEALSLFAQMVDEGFEPDEITFVAVLSACDHGGFADEALGVLSRMEKDHGVAPAIEHYTCVVNALGRAGRLGEAYEMVRSMPVEPNPVVWRALMAACKIHGDKDLAEIALERSIKLEPGNCGGYVMMSNIYLEAGQFEEVSRVRGSMREQNLKKIPGVSWIELKSGVHAFVTADRCHPEAELIYAQLISLTARLHELGYVPHL